MKYRYEQRVRPAQQGGGRCLLVSLVVLVWVALAGLWLMRSHRPGELLPAIERRLATVLPPTEVPLQPGIATAVPLGVPRPAGHQVVITEQQANQYYQEYRDQVPGIDDVVVHFSPGVVTADVTVGPLTGTVTSGVAVQAGRVVLVNPQLAPPLNSLVNIKPLAQRLEQRLNQELTDRDYSVTGIQIDQGKVTVSTQ